MESTTLMRVPTKFKEEVERLKVKRGFKSCTKFLSNEGVRIFKNVDTISDLFIPFQNRRHRR